MKKMLCILLCLLLPAIPALAEENPFTPYVLTAPEGVQMEINEGSTAFILGSARVLAMVIDRVPDEEPADAIIRLMAQFEPDAVQGEALVLAEGYTGLTAVNEGRFGEGRDQLIVMILSDGGDLLILSASDLTDDETQAQALLDQLLTTLAAEGTGPLMTKE